MVLCECGKAAIKFKEGKGFCNKCYIKMKDKEKEEGLKYIEDCTGIKMKLWNLSKEEQSGYDCGCGKNYNDLAVKKFIKRDTELINQYACSQLTLLELKQEREKLAGEKLK